MIKGDTAYLKDLTISHACAECGGLLSVAWHAKEKCEVLRCGNGHYPEEVTPWETAQEQQRHNPDIEPGKPEEKKKPSAKRGGASLIQPTAVTLAGVPAVDLGNGELIPRDRLEALVKYGLDYGLDPRRGHVCLMYGKPYIMIDGYLYHANRTGINYTLKSRPLTTAEKDIFQVGPTDHGWISTVVILATGTEFQGVGVVTCNEMTEKSKSKPDQLKSPVVAKHPWQLTQKRAEWQALRRAFPIGGQE